MKVTEILQQFDNLSKSDRLQFASLVVEEITDGNCDPIKIHSQLKTIEDIIFKLTSTDKAKNKDGLEFANIYKDTLLEECQKHGKEFEFGNAKISIGEVGTKYDYSECNDIELLMCQDKCKKADEELKEREKFLKNIPPSGIEAINSDGEAITIFPPKKTSTTSAKFTLK